MASRPEIMQTDSLPYKILRNYGKTKTHAGKSRVFGEAADLDGAGARPVAFIDAVGNALFCDIGLISGVIDDHSACLIGVIHPLLKPLLRDGGSAGIVGETQIDKVRRLFRKFRKEPFSSRHGI